MAVRAYPLETGGILLGQWAGTLATVTDVIGPGPGARHERRNFEPDQTWQVGEVARLWEAGGGQIAYLGDWHTHPNGRPRLSSEDRAAARLIAASREARCRRPIMVVVALGHDCALRTRADVFADDSHRRASVILSGIADHQG